MQNNYECVGYLDQYLFSLFVVSLDSSYENRNSISLKFNLQTWKIEEKKTLELCMKIVVEEYWCVLDH